jgi:colanic acid biosynthesis glycosyl transferase WcaI
MSNVILLTANFFPEFTGIAVHTTDLSFELSNSGNHVSVFTAVPYYPDWEVHIKYRGKKFFKEKFGKVKVYRNWLYVPKNRKGINSFQRIIHEISFVIFQQLNLLLNIRKIINADYVIIFSPPFLQGINAILLASIFRKKVIFQVEDIQPDSAIDLGLIDKKGIKKIVIKILRLLEKLIYKYCYKVSTLTPGMRQNIQGKIQNSDHVILLPYWIDFNVFKKDDQARKRFRERLSLRNDCLLVGYAGNIGKKQNLDYLLNIAVSSNLDSKVHFFIAGEGAEKYRIKNYLEKMHLNKITLLPLLQGQDYIDFLNGIDLSYISQDENADKIFIPSKLYKTLSCGSPVICIADKNSELAKIIAEAQAGFVLTFADLDHTIYLLNMLSKNKQQIYDMRNKAYLFAYNEFNKQKIILEFFNSI